MNTHKTPDEIIDEGKSIPRPIVIPNSIIGYFADLMIDVAKIKASKINKSSTLTRWSLIKRS